MANPIVNYTATPQPVLSVVLVDAFLDITIHEKVRVAIENAWKDGIAFVEVEMGSVEFMDSSGVGLLVGLHKRLGGGQKRVILKNLRPTLKSIFKLLCLEDLFEFA